MEDGGENSLRLVAGANMCSKENKVRFDLTTDEIKSLSEEIKRKMTEVGDQVVNVEGRRTFENTIAPLAKMDLELSPMSSSCDFAMHVSSDAKIREASQEADEDLRKFSVDFYMREDLYKAVMAYEEERRKSGEKLGHEAQRYVDRLILDFKRDGLHLDPAKRERITELKKQLSEKEVQFQKNLNEDTAKLSFSLSELEGLSDDYLSSLESAEDGKKFVSLKYPELFPAMKKCKVEATRRALDSLRSVQCQEVNTPLLEDALQLRSELAELLGYESHAAYILELRMAKTTAAVQEMYDKLIPRLIPPAREELGKLLKLKEEEKKGRKEEFDGKINSWDFQYYHTLLAEKEFSVNEDVICEYFPLNVVKQGLIDAYQQILGLTFTQVENPQKLWHPDVEMFEVSLGL
ncbi:hypothetical protein GUITHDRAFT_166948 [Guillardia theta CCMP2712]|uniref:Peptidase M3A/M3B catalytic domain-containing protein n=1 Tax=Guillardia theta (strain CCMP2712) TaxID=905079 RepID=L1I5J4_GUITC|nr:hypothetical protein GUITHDRAFT_166948 [Guillardia theta CCMP2712]EKX31130.1 hypothetical protein GUITHDRAFT_166948 [Guillardia theta CCMP2712]|eukprot:XP_005818110.1 hypothetical protein GUITHDRAFT_166948 [Guillardia theta CCMP2712]